MKSERASPFWKGEEKISEGDARCAAEVEDPELSRPAFLRLQGIGGRTGEAKENSQFTDHLAAEKEGGG